LGWADEKWYKSLLHDEEKTERRAAPGCSRTSSDTGELNTVGMACGNMIKGTPGEMERRAKHLRLLHRKSFSPKLNLGSGAPSGGAVGGVCGTMGEK